MAQRQLILWLLFLGTFALAIPSAKEYPFKPKLVVFLVVDQFRADYLTRYGSRFLPARLPNGEKGGLRYLTENGAYFPQSSFGILQAMTAPGHAVIASGSYPYANGIIQNRWYDPANKKEVYCVEDSESPLVGAQTEVGISPRNFIGTTFPDELKNSGTGSTVVSLALKDRAAVLMGGKRSDATFWFRTEEMRWVSSRYYVKNELPAWVKALNVAIEKRKGQKQLWRQGPNSETTTPNTFYTPGKVAKSPFGLAFPHTLQWGDFSSIGSPVGFEILEEALVGALKEYRLGSGKRTDYLSLSYSGFDYLGHDFGPNSPEMEQMTYDLDRSISKVLNQIHKAVPGGLDQALIVLTADHGVAPIPEWMAKNGVEATRVDRDALEKQIEAALIERFGEAKGGWLLAEKEMQFYVNPEALVEKKVALEDVQAAIKVLVSKTRGFSKAFSSSDYAKGLLPVGRFRDLIEKTYFPGRSGDVVGILSPYSFEGKNTVTHLTGYRYDDTVPIIFAGKPFRKGVYPDEIRVADIAPTMSWLLGILPPAQSEGKVLTQAIR